MLKKSPYLLSLSGLILVACVDPATQYRADSFKPSADSNEGVALNSKLKNGGTLPVNIVGIQEAHIQVDGSFGKGVSITYMPLDGTTTTPQISIQAGKISEYKKGAAQLVASGENSTRIQPNVVK